MENLKKFYSALSSDEALRDRASILNEKYSSHNQPSKTTIAEDIVAFAKTEGFHFTVDNLIDYHDYHVKELTDDELDAIAGGAYNEHTKCFIFGNARDEETGYRCICILGGAGMEDKDGNYLYCAGFGVMDNASRLQERP